MISGCPIDTMDSGVIRSLLSATDCNVSRFSEVGYRALTGPHSVFPLALTAMLTIYVALLGYRMLFGYGGTQLSDTPVIALKIGAIVALALNWSNFQTLVLDFSYKAPLEIGRTIGSAQTDPLGKLQEAYNEIVADQAAFAQLAASDPPGGHTAELSAAKSLSHAASALFWSTAGVLACAMIGIGVLTAIGPVFIALFLFEITRGLFAGWVRAMAAMALAPMVSWVTIVVLLLTLQPWLDELQRQRAASAMSVDTATIVTALVYVFAAAQAGLVSAGGFIASGFHFRSPVPRAVSAAAQTNMISTFIEPQSRAQLLAQSVQRLSLTNSSGPHWMPNPTIYDAPSSRGAATPAESSPRAMRLGETYRRSVYRPREDGAV